ncbi:hypothetical protein Syun_001884 [Stephania yunnanensis]|uniref:Uncharacterized protein n=1 Tax=Stephania yunnanensis TaxID=152371 RepID=A0AAP0LKG1_9MAGN
MGDRDEAKVVRLVNEEVEGIEDLRLRTVVWDATENRSTTTEYDKSKVRCRTDQRPPNTTNLRFVAEHINDHLRQSKKQILMWQSQNNRTVEQRISESMKSMTDSVAALAAPG